MMRARGSRAGGPAGTRSGTHRPIASATALLRGLCMLAALLAVLAIVAITYQVIHGAQRRPISRFGLGFLGHSTWQPNFGMFGAATFIYGTAVTSLDRAAARGAARDLDRALPEPAGAASGAQRDRAAGGDARGDPERDPRLLGHPRARPLPAGARRAGPAQRARLHPDLRRRPHDRQRAVHRRPDPDDHGRADHRLDQPRSLPDASRASSRTARPRSARRAGR